MPDLLGPGAAGALNARASRPAFTPLNQGAGDTDTWAGDCSSPSAADGTQDKAAHMNMLLAQLRSPIRASAVAENSADDFMLTRAIRSNQLNRMNAGGSANAITLTPVAPAPAFASLADLAFVPLRFLATADNTAAVTLNVSGLGALALTWADGTPLQTGDIRTGQLIYVFYDGTAFRLGRDTPSFGSVEVFTASGAFTVKSTRPHKVTVVGGGASGGSTGNGTGPTGGGGGAGGAAIKRIRGLTIGATVTVTVGLGGASVAGTATPVGNAGNSGSSSSFGAFCSATGGTGGVSGNSSTPAPGGLGGIGSGGDINLRGGAGGDGTNGSTGIGGNGGNSLFGGAGRAATIRNSPVQDGVAPGAGGGAAYFSASTASGAGADGIVIVEY